MKYGTSTCSNTNRWLNYNGGSDCKQKQGRKNTHKALGLPISLLSHDRPLSITPHEPIQLDKSGSRYDVTKTFSPAQCVYPTLCLVLVCVCVCVCVCSCLTGIRKQALLGGARSLVTRVTGVGLLCLPVLSLSVL